MTSPAVNHRALHSTRIWCEHAKLLGDNPGIIATLLGLPSTQPEQDGTLSYLDYLIFPYKLTMKPADISEGTHANSEFVLSHLKDVDSQHAATHIGSQDIADLIQLLSMVRSYLTSFIY
jgi:hypothetical protein